METVEAAETRDSPVEIEENASHPSVGNAPQELDAISKLVRSKNGCFPHAHAFSPGPCC